MNAGNTKKMTQKNVTTYEKWDLETEKWVKVSRTTEEQEYDTLVPQEISASEQ